MPMPMPMPVTRSRSGRTLKAPERYEPKEEIIDDYTDDESDVDDDEDIVRGRLKIYHKQTEPLVQYYKADALDPSSGTKFIAINGVGSLDEVQERITSALVS